MSKSYRRKNKIAGQFSARTIEMMESPAFNVLSLSGHRVLHRIEIEPRTTAATTTASYRSRTTSSTIMDLTAMP
jgi:hypothetical protein